MIDANSNEKRLKEEKNDLIETDSKYYETEKLSNQDLEVAKENLKKEQDKVDRILDTFSSENLKKKHFSLTFLPDLLTLNSSGRLLLELSQTKSLFGYQKYFN